MDREKAIEAMARAIYTYDYDGDWSRETDECKNQHRAVAHTALDAALSAGLCKGDYVLVPREPTEAMIDEADRAVALPEGYIRKVYAAMVAVAAAPTTTRED